MRAPCAAAVLLSLCGACTTQFDPCFPTAQKIRDLRVLGVRADPPEVVFDWAQPAPDPVRISLLAVDPFGTDDFKATATLCAPTDDRRCPPGSLQLTPTQGSTDELFFDVVPPLQLLRDALAADPLAGYGGIRLQLDVAVQSVLNQGVHASKLLLYTPAAPGYVPNHAFDLSGIVLARRGPALKLYPDKGADIFDVGEKVGVLPILAPAPGMPVAIEQYDVVDLAGHSSHLTERFSYAFFSTRHLKFDADTADQPPPGISPPVTGLLQFELTAQAQGTFYVVARDGRGAEAWITFDWTAMDERLDDKPRNLEVDCE
jgi:hypothetical protein